MNKYEHYQLEDFLQDELFIQWCYRATPELNEFWHSWCEQYPDKVPVLQKAREIAQSIEYKEQTKASEEVYQRILQEVLQKSETKALWNNRQSPWLNLRKIAAAIVLLLTASVAFYLSKQDLQPTENTQQTISYIEKYCPTGKKMNIQLKDGTWVKLNAGSYLKYPESLGDNTGNKTREVELRGEAFFEVAKHANRPFVIRSRHLQTTVLGTTFNVQAYPESKTLDVAVVEGLVQVNMNPVENYREADSVEFLVSPGEKLSYKIEEKMWEKGNVSIASIGRWRNGELVFEQADVMDIAHKLTRWYGIKVVVEGPFSREISFSGIYSNEHLYTVLEGITYSANLNYSIQGDTVIIKP